ncbi:hypothetical protein BJK06_12825 [Curtobacterium sp. BH-2-1-1]|nr:hypothetical protein BJK06_12825 [Curtobacterium sp. BH-2-1-1]
MPAVTVRFTFTFAVLEAGADEDGVLRVHQTALARAASFVVMLGSDAQVPETEPVPTEVDAVQAAVPVTGHATTLTACARAVELPDTTETVVVAVPASDPALVRVSGFVVLVTLEENVVVMSLVPVRDAPVFPMVTLEAVVPVALQSAHAADDPPTTNASASSPASTVRSRRLMR